jgi:iodotyrosine deiodinase
MKEEHIPYGFEKCSSAEVEAKAGALLNSMQKRRSLRFFSEEDVSKQTIADLLNVASSAPSGANKQPWTFVAISNVELKKRIREAAEKEEQQFYGGRASDTWLADLAPLGTDWQKPFIETAPWIVVVFRKTLDDDGSKNYYVQESVGIACGFLISAIHQAGLVTLTHTPSPMNFLSEILKRPANEKPYLLLPIGFPAADATVPNIKKKDSSEVIFYFE